MDCDLRKSWLGKEIIFFLILDFKLLVKYQIFVERLSIV